LKVCPKIPKAEDILAAEARPCNPLKTSNAISFGITGHSTEAVVNQADPARKTRRFPYTSAMRPKSKRKQPKVRE
jgi:hypothetical protein